MRLPRSSRSLRRTGCPPGEHSRSDGRFCDDDRPPTTTSDRWQAPLVAAANALVRSMTIDPPTLDEAANAAANPCRGLLSESELRELAGARATRIFQFDSTGEAVCSARLPDGEERTFATFRPDADARQYEQWRAPMEPTTPIDDLAADRAVTSRGGLGALGTRHGVTVLTAVAADEGLAATVLGRALDRVPDR